MALTRQESAAYLAGIIDGEGSVSFAHSSGAKNDPARISGKKIVRIANTDQDIIDATCRCLDLLGIGYRLHKLPRRNLRHRQAWEISISKRDDLIAIDELVPLQSVKRERLKKALASYVHPAVPRRDELERLYIGDGLSAAQIGALFGVSPTTAYQWLLRRGIQRRSLSAALRLRKGRERSPVMESPL